ncbi:MAG: hypothetical protein FWC71_09760 [Defluviitaleaceae bacterium]|nr:hypothetical protein [Defluviitaleaceae bacterium]
MHLYHYYDKSRTPFLNMSDLSEEESIQLHTKLAKKDGSIFAMRDSNGQYMNQRRIVEQRAHSMFVRKGGNPQRTTPHYMILAKAELEECKAWFSDCAVVKIPLEEFDKNTLSFTYGDSFPTFKPIFDEQLEYDLFLYDEILKVIAQRGMPPTRNNNMSWLEPSYIEVQVWSDETIDKYRC